MKANRFSSKKIKKRDCHPEYSTTVSLYFLQASSAAALGISYHQSEFPSIEVIVNPFPENSLPISFMSKDSYDIHSLNNIINEIKNNRQIENLFIVLAKFFPIQRSHINSEEILNRQYF